MTGIFNIEIYNRRVRYQLTIRRNVTIIRGDSATGKTYLLSLITQYNNGVQGAVQLNVTPKSVPCIAATDILWDMGALKNVQNSIIFIDEDAAFINKNEFENYFKHSTNYFVFITRHLRAFDQIPYSVCEIYEMQQVNNKQVYTNGNGVINTLVCCKNKD